MRRSSKGCSRSGREGATKERVTQGKDQVRVVEVKDTLKGMYLDHNAFQEEEKKKATMELKNLSLAYAEVQTQARADRKVLQQVKQIVVGKPFFASVYFLPQGVH